MNNQPKRKPSRAKRYITGQRRREKPDSYNKSKEYSEKMSALQQGHTADMPYWTGTAQTPLAREGVSIGHYDYDGHSDHESRADETGLSGDETWAENILGG